METPEERLLGGTKRLVVFTVLEIKGLMVSVLLRSYLLAETWVSTELAHQIEDWYLSS